MEISEKEFKKLMELVERLNSTVESSTKKIEQYTKRFEEQADKATEEFAALSAKVEKLLKARAAGEN